VCTPGTGVNLWGESPLESPVIMITVNTSISRKQGWNCEGTSNIGLADIIDSLLVIKQLVFDEKKINFQELKKAIDLVNDCTPPEIDKENEDFFFAISDFLM
jgi:DNA helicase TIP49 (TBP-interacting protein)